MSIAVQDIVIAAIVIAAAGYLLVMWVRRRRRRRSSCEDCACGLKRIHDHTGRSSTDPKSSAS